MTKDLTWLKGQRVEAMHPGTARMREWRLGVVKSQSGHYVRVRLDDGTEYTTDHLNVREPGSPDPVSLL